MLMRWRTRRTSRSGGRSTALFDAHGEMVMQAEHIPVHLGAMPAAVAAVLECEHAPAGSWVLNDPFARRHAPARHHRDHAGLRGGGELLGFAASRAHHADVGGPTPGSMPADSRTLADEGVVIAPQPLDEDAIARLVAQMRQPEQRRADLRAQLAANRAGAQRLAAAGRARSARDAAGGDGARCSTTPSGARAPASPRSPTATRTRATCWRADGDLELELAATVDGERLLLDFTGSAAQHDGNLNCPLAVTRSAC